MHFNRASKKHTDIELKCAQKTYKNYNAIFCRWLHQSFNAFSPFNTLSILVYLTSIVSNFTILYIDQSFEGYFCWSLLEVLPS